jgi:hypothetical protein
MIVKAWTEPGPFEWYGTHYKQRYVNPWPRPLQQPHLPIWSPSQGSTETVSWAAERRYTYLQTFSSTPNIKKAFALFREAANGFGYEPEPEQMAWSVPIVVADTDAEARRIAAPHLEFLFNTLIRMPKDVFYPAGYLSEASARRPRRGGSWRRSRAWAPAGPPPTGSSTTASCSPAPPTPSPRSSPRRPRLRQAHPGDPQPQIALVTPEPRQFGVRTGVAEDRSGDVLVLLPRRSAHRSASSAGPARTPWSRVGSPGRHASPPAAPAP